MKDRLSISLNMVQAAWALILVLTLLQGFYNSLYYEFINPANATSCTFLFSPQDSFGDLIKPSLTMPPFREPDTSKWAPQYRDFYENSSYISLDLTKQNLWSFFIEKGHPSGKISCLHVTPVTLVSYLTLKRVILNTSPEVAVFLYCTMGVIGLGLVCLCLGSGSTFERISTGLILLFSYPYLMILSRGNTGSMVTGLCLVMFLFNVCYKRYFLLTCVYFLIAVLFRPNAIMLAPLLLCWDWKRFLIGSTAVIVMGAIILSLCLHIDGILYPGYTFGTFLTGYKIYNLTYILEGAGDQFNNSAYGCIKAWLYLIGGEDITRFYGFLFELNNILLIFFSFLILFAASRYCWNNLTKCQFAFIAVASYTLGTAVFGTYHTFPFAAFLFILGREVTSRVLVKQDYIMLAATAFIFIPKNYMFIKDNLSWDTISWEVIWNPIVLFFSILYILLSGPKDDTLPVQLKGDLNCESKGTHSGN